MKEILRRDSLLYIKWSLLFFTVSLVLSGWISLKVDSLDARTSTLLTASQQRLNNARRQVDAIEEEEATVVQYTDRYNALAAQGILNEEDRLAFKEYLARIRERHNLFLIPLNLSEQNSINIPYPASITGTREPTDLKFSTVDFTMALLHEQDMIRLLKDLLDAPGLYFPRKCQIRSNYRSAVDYYFLAQHFTGECEMYWYTLDTDPAPGGQR